MTPQERRDCVTAVQLAVRSEEHLLVWGQRLSVDHRRQVLALLVRQGDQRAVRMWEDACLMSDERVKGRD
jgi:hypothetical protein